MKKELEEQLYIVGLFFLIFGGIGIYLYLYVIMPHLKLPSCMCFRVLGIYCPGCGGTRAVLALLHRDFLLSLWYHPLVLYTVVIFGGFMLTQTLERFRFPGIRGWKFHVWHLMGAVILMTVNFVGKNILLLCFHITM